MTCRGRAPREGAAPAQRTHASAWAAVRPPGGVERVMGCTDAASLLIHRSAFAGAFSLLTGPILSPITPHPLNEALLPSCKGVRGGSPSANPSVADEPSRGEKRLQMHPVL